MQLLPEGTLRRRVFEAIDRWLGHDLFTGNKTVSTDCGDQIKAGGPCRFCRIVCWLLNFMEKDHCIKNAGKQ